MNQSLIVIKTRKSGVITIQGMVGKTQITRNYVSVSKPTALKRFRMAQDRLEQKRTACQTT